MKSLLRFTSLAIISAIVFAACSSSKAENETVDMGTLKTEIQAMEDAFAAGEKAKDADAVAAYYADDAISYTRNKEPKVGKAAIKQSIEEGFTTDSAGENTVYELVDVFAEGNQVVEIGSWKTSNSDGTAKANGHYMSLFEKRNGKYVCVRDMSVTSNPAKPEM